ncbi:carbohydrate kinase family protein [Chitinophaga rhizophila]|uniref:Carbohydrate kinase n=1 Tax=Chitinophaga rhizophila TaxID=2866212 RepID=A0ABS7GFN1_9BACT|nr:carbohydrate kinase [Chitinophaga rhizophila]MBW8685925.1 carbohydrate kinase [Chitinophaga rhizophila]
MTQYQVACFGEVLWDILPDKALPGGAPMNVAYHLQKLSVPVAMISSVGNDEQGQSLLEIMKKYQLTTDFIQKDPAHETGKVYAQASPDNPLEMKYDIVRPVAWDYIDFTPALKELAQQPNDTYLVFGSLAARNTTSRQTLQSLLEGNRTFILDINLRPPHFEKELLVWLLHQCHVLKLNESELAMIGGWHQWPDTIEGQVKALSSQYSIQTIIVTLGENGAALFSDGKFYRHPGYKVKVADTIGSGDAFLAGFIYSTIKGYTPADTLSFACAIGALVASYSGGCPDYKREEITTLMAAH